MSAAVAFAVIASAAQADVQIEFTGVDLVYDGSSIYDAGSSAGGLADPADADPLASVDFFVNGGLVGSITSDVSLDVFIPDVAGMSDAANTVDVQTTPGNPGFFDLLIGTSPIASEFLIIDLGSVTITYIDISNLAQFTFGASISDTYSQNLPFGLVITGPVTVSFSAQVDPDSITSAGGFITGFTAAGTGEVNGVPAPGALALLGLAGMCARRRRRN
jgi:MYXO-CTERM domain-containing protein